MRSVLGRVGSANRLSARFAAGRGLGCEELVDALVGNAEDGSGVAHAEPAASQSGGCFAGLLDGQAVGVAGVFSGLLGLLDGPSCDLWQYWSGDELDRGFLCLEPQGGGLPHPDERLVDGLAPGVDPGFFFELDRPAPVVFFLQAGGVGGHGLLRHVGACVVSHLVSHFGPRHGSRSRSIDLSVPGVRSPACTGITVWQVPQRQIWCDPRWRTESQPRSRSLRISTRAVTSRVYRSRQKPVQVNRHVLFAPVGEVRGPEGERVAHGGFDVEAEDVADAADVSAGGVDFLEDAVFSQRLGTKVGSGPGELFADRGEAGGAAPADEEVGGAAPADEEVGVDAGRPGSVRFR